MLTTLPLLQARAAPCREVSHQFPVPPVGKENQGLEAGVHLLSKALWVTLGETLLCFLTIELYSDFTTEIIEESMGLKYCESDCDREVGKGLQQQAQGSCQTKFTCAVPKY